MRGSRSRRWRRALQGVIATAAVVGATLGLGSEPAGAEDAIERTLTETGSWEVTWGDGSDDCDNDGAPSGAFTIVRPTELGAGDYDHPVIVWGNGTNTRPCAYRRAFRHWASWGFVVVAANTSQSGTGNEMLMAVTDIIDQNSDPSSVFYQNLDTDSIAAAGHSQGAIGAINATLKGNGRFSSVLALSTPDREDLTAYNLFCAFSPGCIRVPIPSRSSMNQLGAPILFVRGSGLHNPAPCQQDDWMSDKTQRDWHPTASVPFADGTVRVDPPEDGRCPGFPDPTYPHLDLSAARGYMTAWLGYTLNGNALARAAFVQTSGNQPEILTNTPKWSKVTLRNLST